MISKTPVIASDIPVLKEICKDGALFFNPFDSSELAHIIISILSNSLKRDELITRGLNIASNYTWEKTAKNTLNVYNKLF